MAEGDTQLDEGQHCLQVDGLLAVFVGGDHAVDLVRQVDVRLLVSAKPDSSSQ